MQDAAVQIIFDFDFGIEAGDRFKIDRFSVRFSGAYLETLTRSEAFGYPGD